MKFKMLVQLLIQLEVNRVDIKMPATVIVVNSLIVHDTPVANIRHMLIQGIIDRR